MTSEAIATVEAYFDAFGTRDLERILAHFAPDATWTVPGDPALTPWAGSRTGPEEIRRSLTASEMILRFTVTDGLITDYRVFEDSLGITRTHLGEPLTELPPIVRPMREQAP
ncbi:nuclear transport factor 2 family protein [Streptomyces sp. NPDC002328]|uniref:nuclear transport factor 2 family protein n=1 Tax=Streptomyces sp. NPDC002328 TaxID=3364642 RepID=UPI003679E937